MVLLHYTLGFSPYRSGGLTRYAKDLMLAQIELGHKVYAFYPSGSHILKKKCSIKYEQCLYGINVYKMINPFPVPLYYGIKNPEAMMNERNLNVRSFQLMLDKVMPDVLHIHTLMGLPKRYLEIAHERGIRIVYTSHDYYGLCPKVNLINNEGKICNEYSEEACAMCNCNAKPVWFLKVRNLKCLVPLKNIARRIMK